MKFNGYSIFIVLLLGLSFSLSGEPYCFNELDVLEEQVANDLKKVNIPYARTWTIGNQEGLEDGILDVAIIGGGMSGMTTSLALFKEGITNIKIFDENEEGFEGPWIKYARMNILRSGKLYMGPAMGIPSLTFHAWYEALYGEERWNQLKAIPTKLWQKYLMWFRHAIKLRVENRMTLVDVIPKDGYFELVFNKNGEEDAVCYARKIVLATGRGGFGGMEIPDFLKILPKELYAHTGEKIEPAFFKDKRIAVVGAGASGFDVAGVALENGALSVEMIVRRQELPKYNKFNHFFFPGIVNGFYSLSDEMRCQFFAEGLSSGNPPPKEAQDRVKKYDNFHVHYGMSIREVVERGNVAILETTQGSFEVDYIMAATGYRVDVSKQKELSAIAPYIQLWEKKVPSELLKQFPKMGLFPYLGAHFEFLEAAPGTAPHLKHIYCFNHGAFLSQGIGGDIPLISIAASRLAQGIAADFFLENSAWYFEQMQTATQ